MGDLDVVDGDSALTIRSYDQILLFCLIVRLYVLDRRAINFASGERRIAKIRLNI